MADSSPQVTVNGKPYPYAGGMTVATLLAGMSGGAKPGVVVVEVNGNILEAAQHAATPLAAGDVVEIVQFVGGG